MNTQTKIKEICPTTTMERVKNGALLVDVREKDEIEELAFDVPNILEVPLSEFGEQFSQIPQNREVVMVCRGGGRSLRAAGFLLNHGYTQVVNMQHGILRWAQKGFPTRGNASAASQKDSDCCSSSGCC